MTSSNYTAGVTHAHQNGIHPSQDSDQSRRAMLLDLIRAQVDYYFSDQNLATDSYLQKVMSANRGQVPTTVISSFPKIQRLYRSSEGLEEDCIRLLIMALQNSSRVAVVGDYLVPIHPAANVETGSANNANVITTTMSSSLSSSSSTELELTEREWLCRVEVKDCGSSNNPTVSTCSPTSFASETVIPIPSSNGLDGNDNSTLTSPDTNDVPVNKLESMTIETTSTSQSHPAAHIPFHSTSNNHFYHYSYPPQHQPALEFHLQPVSFGYPAMNIPEHYQAHNHYHPPYYYSQPISGPPMYSGPESLVATSHPYPSLVKGYAIDGYGYQHFNIQHQNRQQSVPAADYHPIPYERPPVEGYHQHSDHGQRVTTNPPAGLLPDQVGNGGSDTTQSIGIGEGNSEFSVNPQPNVFYVQPASQLPQSDDKTNPIATTLEKLPLHPPAMQSTIRTNDDHRKSTQRNRKNPNNNTDRRHRKGNKNTKGQEQGIQQMLSKSDSNLVVGAGTMSKDLLSNCSESSNSTSKNVNERLSASLNLESDQSLSKDKNNSNRRKVNRRATNNSNPNNNHKKKNYRSSSQKLKDDQNNLKESAMTTTKNSLSEENFPALLPSNSLFVARTSPNIEERDESKNHHVKTNDSSRMSNNDTNTNTTLNCSVNKDSNEHNENRTPIKKIGYAQALLKTVPIPAVGNTVPGGRMTYRTEKDETVVSSPNLKTSTTTETKE